MLKLKQIYEENSYIEIFSTEIHHVEYFLYANIDYCVFQICNLELYFHEFLRVWGDNLKISATPYVLPVI